MMRSSTEFTNIEGGDEDAFDLKIKLFVNHDWVVEFLHQIEKIPEFQGKVCDSSEMEHDR